MPIPGEDKSDWLQRLEAAPDRTVLAVADLIHAEAAALPPMHMLRIAHQHFNRLELDAVEIQLRLPEPGYGQRALARAYIADSAIIDATQK